jgi:iron complex outermembrane receptor protein
MLDPGILNAGQLHSNRDVSRTYYQDMFDLTGEHQGDLRPG